MKNQKTKTLSKIFIGLYLSCILLCSLGFIFFKSIPLLIFIPLSVNFILLELQKSNKTRLLSFLGSGLLIIALAYISK